MDGRTLLALAADVDLRPELLLGVVSATRLRLLLDYDGTLVPIAARPDDAAPDGALLATLKALAARGGTEIAVVSSRDRATLARWFEGVPIELYAGNGAWVADASRCWRERARADNAWQAIARPALERIASERAGAWVEARETSMALHHLAVERPGGLDWARAVRGRVEPILAHADVRVEVTRRAVEMRPRAHSKRNAVLDALALRPPGALVLAAGDDAPDEEMFAAMRGAGVALRVGEGPSVAPWRVADVWALRRLLAALASPEIAYR
ncbi:MAG: trehalose-phosphatase [Polyangiales bacterium]